MSIISTLLSTCAFVLSSNSEEIIQCAKALSSIYLYLYLFLFVVLALFLFTFILSSI